MMDEYKLGFIGVGHMGSALVEAAVKSVDARAVAISNRTAAKAEALSHRCGCDVLTSGEAARRCRYVVIGVKPQNFTELFTSIAPVLRERTDRFVLVSMAAGVNMERISREAGVAAPIIRIMPNTPVAVGAGCTLIAANELVEKGELEEFKRMLSCAGVFVDLPEALFDAGAALSGSGPAFVCQFLISLADAGEKLGIPAETALALAKATVSGTSKLVESGSETPQKLRDAVCSSGGSTIEGVKVMRAGEFDAALAGTLRATYERNLELGKL